MNQSKSYVATIRSAPLRRRAGLRTSQR